MVDCVYGLIRLSFVLYWCLALLISFEVGLFSGVWICLFDLELYVFVQCFVVFASFVFLDFKWFLSLRLVVQLDWLPLMVKLLSLFACDFRLRWGDLVALILLLISFIACCVVCGFYASELIGLCDCCYFRLCVQFALLDCLAFKRVVYAQVCYSVLVLNLHDFWVELLVLLLLFDYLYIDVTLLLLWFAFAFASFDFLLVFTLVLCF